ncbi:MAG: hypothetical protein KDB03_13005 [Planctomycetales bacterium]|nr:hypothetical protein [Planctomycetales bacterium]
MEDYLDVSKSEPAQPHYSALLNTRFRTKRHLIVKQLETVNGVETWIVFNPLTRQSYRVGRLESELLLLFDGRRTLRSCLESIYARVVDRQKLDRIVHLVTWLKKQELITSQPMNPHSQQASHHRNFTERWTTFVSSFVVWQIRGPNWERYLGYLAKRTNYLFSAMAVATWTVLFFIVTMLLVLDWNRLVTQAVGWQWCATPALGGSFFFIMLITRTIHELGHAVVCTRFGVRCPDIGLLFILGAPCVYCDVSESWLLAKRRDRASIAAAGMYCELVVACLAGLLWSVTQSGAINTLAFQTLVTCSVSTIAFNANPLMRFDGYFILSDWLNETNLRAKADSTLEGWIDRFMFAELVLPPRVDWRKLSYVLYSLSGKVYRVGLSLVIANSLFQIYANWNLEWFGRVLAAVILCTWWIVPMMRYGILLMVRIRHRKKIIPATVIGITCVIALVAIPFPVSFSASGWMRPKTYRHIYAGHSGILQTCYVTEGQHVAAGDPLFQLSSIEIGRRMLTAHTILVLAEADALAAKRQQDLTSQQVSMVDFEQRRDTAAELLANVERTQSELDIRAPIDGQVLVAQAPSLKSTLVNTVKHEYRRWDDPNNSLRAVSPDTLLATLINEQRQIVVPIPSDKLSVIPSDATVRIWVQSKNPRMLLGKLAAIVPLESSNPKEFNNLFSWDGSMVQHRESRQHFAIINLDCPNELIGTRVQVRVELGTQTALEYLLDWLRLNLKFFA